MQFETFEINGPALLKPHIIRDDRGYFIETFKEAWFRQNIADVIFVQDNQSLSIQAGTIRGLHYQRAPYAQGKLIRCLRGSIFDVAVDIRPESSSFGRWISATLTAEKSEQLWIPEGFAHAFCTLEENCEVYYKVTKPYSRDHDSGIAFDDPKIGIQWPIDIATAVLSDKDRIQPKLASLIENNL